ncbi:hypothetical protein SprV_0301171600 [Sparganum proliferum]
MWRCRHVPQDFKDVTIVHLYKLKGNWKLRDNHRGISLPNIAGKISVLILLNPLNDQPEHGHLLESQYGFRRHRDITDSSPAAEMPGIANSPLHYLRGIDESLRYGESRRIVENHAETRLS